MVTTAPGGTKRLPPLSVLALSSRFDGRDQHQWLKRVRDLSVLALSSRFDGPILMWALTLPFVSFSTRSVESF